jgi:hypothetical protein
MYLFDEISPNEMATTHLEQVAFMISGVSKGDVVEVLVQIFGQVVWDEMRPAIGAHHGLLQHLTRSGDYFGEEKKVESVDPVTSQGASYVIFLTMPFMDVIWDDDLCNTLGFKHALAFQIMSISINCIHHRMKCK